MDNGIYRKTMNLFTTIWDSVWTKIPGATISPPTLEAVTLPSVYLNLVVRGTDNGIYHKVWSSGSGWTGWTNLGGATIDRPALWASSAYLHLFVRGADNGIYYKTMDLSTCVWTMSWTKWPGATSSGPTVEAETVVVRGMDNGIYATV